MNTELLEEYGRMERHYYNLESYISNYSESQTMMEKGSESLRTHEKLVKLKKYQQQLGNYLHKQARLVFPTLSELRND